MKDVIQNIIDDEDNCVFVNSEQVQNVIDIFIKYGMIEPKGDQDDIS